MFDKNRMHLIPPAVEGKAQTILDEKKNFNERSNNIVQLEAIRDFCQWTIDQFQRMTRKVRK